MDISNTTIAKVILLYYLLSVSPFTTNLVSKQLQRFIEDNRIAQHVVAFLILFILIGLESDSNTQLSTIDLLTYTSIGYIWFVFTTKMDIHWNIIVLMMLIGLYVVDRNMRLDESTIKSDPNVSIYLKQKTISKNNKIRTIGIASLAIATGIGTLLYSNKKVGQYGGSYDVFDYFFR